MTIKLEFDPDGEIWIAKCDLPQVEAQGPSEIAAIRALADTLQEQSEGLLPNHVYCDACGGNGTVVIEEDNGEVKVTCPQCDGEGAIYDPENSKIPF